MKKILPLLIALSAGPILGAPERLATVHIRSVGSFVADLSALAQSVQAPVPAEMATGQLGKMLHSPILAGVDLTQPVTLVVGHDADLPARKNKPVAVRFAVTGDGSAYLDAVAQMLPNREEIEPGTHRFTGAFGPVQKTFIVRLNGNQAVAGDRIEDVEALGAPLSDAESAIISDLPGDVSITYNLPSLHAMFRAQVEQQKRRYEEMKAQFSPADAPAGPDPMAGLDAMSSFLGGLIDEVRVLALNVDLKRAVTLRIHVQAQPGSRAGKMIEAMAPPPAKIAGFRNPDAIMTLFGTMRGADVWLEPYGNWLAKFYASMGPPFSGFAEPYREMVRAMAGIYSGGYTFLLLAPQDGSPLRGLGVYEISDAEKARLANDRMMELQREITNPETGEPLVRYNKESSAEYEGIAIDTYTMDMAPDPAMTRTMPPGVAALLTNLHYHVSYMDAHMPFSLGDVGLLHEMIDYVRSDAAPAVEVPGFSDITAPVVGFMDFDIGRLMAIFSPPGTVPSDLSAHIRWLAVKELGGLTALMRLTQEDLQALSKFAATKSAKRGKPRGPPPAPDKM